MLFILKHSLCLLALFCLTVFSQQIHINRRKGTCFDRHDMCFRWAMQGECYNNRGYMAVYCAKSCDQCNVADPLCQDHDVQCAAWADKGECFNNRRFMTKTCAKSCSVCLPAADHSVPHIRSNIVQEYWRGNDIRLDLRRRRF